ncbi:MAG: hypothetical protein EAZ14_09075 [Runella slithyformis]|nr:MAG: hypothetical protein EAZ14_09075 [Runella slithyformis]
MKKYFYLNADPEKKENPAGIISFPKGFDWYVFDDERKKEVLGSIPNISLLKGDATDILSANFSLRIYSAKMKNIIMDYLTDIDNPLWTKINIVLEDNKTVYDYCILQFLSPPSVLNMERTTFVGSNKKLIIKAIYDEMLIGNRHIFTYHNSHINRTIISDELRKAILRAGCTGVYMYDVMGSGKLI